MEEFVRAQDKIGRFDTLVALKDGRIAAVEKRRLYEMPFFLCTDPPNNEVVLPASGTSAEVAMRVSGEGPVQLTQLGAIVGDICLVRLYMRDGSGRRQISNVPLHINTLFGPGGNMYPLPEGLYIDEDRAMSVDFTDLQGGGSVRICAVGAKYTQLQMDPSLVRVKERLKSAEFLSTPQFYGINDGVAQLDAYQTAQYVIEIAGDQNFEIHQLSCASDDQFLINIVDMAKDESIINAPRNGNYPQNSKLYFGDGSYPYRFHEPILVYGGQNLLVTLVNLIDDVNNIYLTLGGVALKVRQWS